MRSLSGYALRFTHYVLRITTCQPPEFPKNHVMDWVTTMWDYLRAIFRSTADKQQEQINAYLDNALPPQERRDFERTLKADPELQTTLTDLRLIKANLAQLPRQRAPRSFALNAAVHGRRRPQPAAQLYPFMRAGVVMSAFFLVLAVVLNLVSGGNQMGMATADLGPQQYESVAMMDSASEADAPEAAAPEAAASADDESPAEDGGIMGVMGEPESDTDGAEGGAEGGAETDANADADRIMTYDSAESESGESPPATAELTAAPPAPAPTIAPEQVAPQPTAVPSQDESNLPQSPTMWQTLQYILAALFVTLSGATLYLRRRLM
jgi:hypothetical protein